MIQQGSPVQGYNRGVVVDSMKLDLGGKHTEANSIMQVMGPQDMYLGILKQWQNYQLINLPILASTEFGKNVIYTNSLGEQLSYSVPVKFALPFTTDDINDTDKPGLGKEQFFLILNTDKYSKSDILTYNLEDGEQAIVDLATQENPVPYGAGSYLYAMVLTSDDPKAYISRRFTKAGVPWVKVSNIQTEFSTEASSINIDSDGLETLMFKTASSISSVEHWMTGHADMIEFKTSGNASQELQKDGLRRHLNPRDVAITYMFNTMGDPNDPQNPDAKKIAAKKGDIGIQPDSTSWMPMIIKWLIREQAKMQEKMYMYSKGGYIVDDGKGHMARIGLGYYPQLKQSGNYHTFSKPSQLVPLMRQVSGDLFFGRTDLPIHERHITWKVAQGALIEIQKWMLDYFKKDVLFPVWAQHPALASMLSGDSQNLNYQPPRFNAVMLPECGWIHVEHDPSLDWMGNQNQTSFVGAYSTKSYRVFIEDITAGSFSNAMPPKGAYGVGDGFENGGNLTLIKPKNYADVYTYYRVGAYCPEFLKTFVGAGNNAHIASMDEMGFKIGMKWAGEVWLKDPSRSVLLEMKDPLQTI